jgi:dTDP-4-amino-4,6-dideoxygalactose transaminase
MQIPLSKPFWGKREEDAVVRAIRETNGVGDGKNSAELVTILQRITGAKHVYPVTSCTHGLELAVAAMAATGRLHPGDEVIVPSFTLSSTANAVILGGAGIPVFADIDPVTYMIDPEDIKKRITKKTRGIILVHYAGMAAPMKELRKIAHEHDLWIIEDAAHAIGAEYEGKALGNVADAGVYSFHGTKNVSCGEGGAVLTNDDALADAMDIYRVNGTNRKAFLDGRVDLYSWVGKGTSFLLSDILSAILVEQLKQINTINKQRTRIASFYTKVLQPYQDIVQLPIVPKGTMPNWHIYALVFKTPNKRKFFVTEIRKRGIEVSTHYVPLDSSVMGKSLTAKKSKPLPVTERIAGTLVRMPIYPGLTAKQRTYIVINLKQALEGVRKVT